MLYLQSIYAFFMSLVILVMFCYSPAIANETKPLSPLNIFEGYKKDLNSDQNLKNIKHHKLKRHAFGSSKKHHDLSKKHHTKTIKPQGLANQLQRLNPFAHNFTIYHVETRLINSSHGSYQKFSVSFDADILSNKKNDVANVYAKIYLSHNNGPWQHITTSQTFTLLGESTEDTYTVQATLTEYIADEYELLIELYEIGFNDVVATYSQAT